MIERTLVLIKPDGVQRKLIGNIIKRFEDNGLEVTSMKMITADSEIVEKHYPAEEDYLISLGKKSADAGDKIDNYKEQGMMIVNGLRGYLTGNAIVAMVIEGKKAITMVRKIVGHTNPVKAEKGSVRGDLGEDDILTANKAKRAVRNLVHASGNKEEAEKEIKLWFDESELE